MPGFTEDNIIELKREAPNEGMHGISPRYIQDKISNAIVAHQDEDSVNPFMVLHELESGLRHHSLITNQEQLQHYRELLSVVRDKPVAGWVAVTTERAASPSSLDSPG